MPSTSLLSIEGINLSDYSVRGLTMELQPLPAQRQTRRDINGTLVDISSSQFRKYVAKISCSDQEAPSLTDVWPGKVVTVSCVPQLGVVEDSDDSDGDILTLSMMVTGWSTSRNEYDAETGWSIELEQV